jgi:hypothetical protein
MSYKDIARIIPSIQSVQLVRHNLKKVKKKKVDTKDILELGIGNIVGVSLIKTEADLIEGL